MQLLRGCAPGKDSGSEKASECPAMRSIGARHTVRTDALSEKSDKRVKVGELLLVLLRQPAAVFD